MTIKGSLQGSIPVVKAFFSRNFRGAVENWFKIAVFGREWGRNIKFCFRDSKRHILERVI